MTKCRKKISNTRTTKRRGNDKNATGRTNVSLFEALENRQLMAVVNVADFGARPGDGQDDRAAIQRAIDASQPGDTVSFGAGEFNSSGMLRFRGNRTYQGAAGATLKSSGSTWAATIEGNASNVTITGMKFVGAGVDLGGGSYYRNIKITESEFADMSGHAIAQRVRTDGLEITNNTFRNIRGYGVIETYNTDRLNYSYNRIIDSTHGGHILGPLQDCTFVGNYMTGLTNWGLEIQDSGSSVSRNMRIEDNVMYDYRQGFGNTGGLSVVNHQIDTSIKNNYIRANFRNMVADKPFWEERLHVAIEMHKLATGEISGNVVGSERTDNYAWQSGVGYANLSARIVNNRFFGKFDSRWGGDGTPGPSVRVGGDSGNSWNRDYADMPAPPPSVAPSRDDEPVDRTDNDTDADTGAEPEQPTPQQPAAETFVWLSDLKWASARNGWGPVERDSSNGERKAGDGDTITLDGKQYRKGLGVAVNSQITYRLDGKYQTIFSTVGIDDYAGDRGSATFEVWADGKKIYDSGVVTHATHAKSLEVDVAGVKVLKLVTTDAGDGGNSDHADWAGAKLVGAA